MNIFKITFLSFFLLCALLTFAQKITPLTQKKYKDVGNVTSKFAYVFDGKKWGVIDETGAEIIPLVYDSICNGIDNYYKNFNVQLDNKWGLYDMKMEKEIVSCEFTNPILIMNRHCIGVSESGKLAIYNFIEKKFVTEYKYDKFEMFNDEGENGYYIFAFKDNRRIAIKEDGTEKYAEIYEGYVIADNWTPPAQFGYEVDSEIKEPKLWVVKNKEKKYGVINSNQVFVVPIIYDDIYAEKTHHYFNAILNNKSILYDYDGKVVVPECEYFRFVNTKCGFCFDFNVNNKRQCLFQDGKTLFDNKYDALVLIGNTNYGFKRVGKECEIITCDGQIVGTEKYDSFKIMGNNFWVLKDKNWQLVTVTE